MPIEREAGLTTAPAPVAAILIGGSKESQVRLA